MSGDAELRVFWERRLGSDWTESGVGYHALGRAFNSWMYRVRRAVFAREVAGLDVGAASRVLDIGSGTGFYIECWRDAGARRIVGCDLTDAAVDRLRRRFPDVEFVRANAADVASELGPASFDMVSCMDVLFHITDDGQYEEAIDGIAQVIRSGGYFVLSENFLHRAEQRGERQVNRSASAIQALLTGAGFEVVRRVPMLVLMNAQVDAPIAWRKIWGGALRAATLTELTGWLAGAALYPIERGLTRWLTESPTTELMICRRT
ncbi:MAG TPA: methyltransferase domain-containing protein [Jiangellaceae bacterium]|nr:methyltransferase domain-containing protein [Jiangellaceae bacterium]